MTDATYGDFFKSLLQELKSPVTNESVLGLCVVSIIEGPNDPASPPARYNPLNCEGQFGTSTAWNSVGVQDYKNYEQGIQATAAFMQGDRWVGVRNALHNDVGFENIIEAFKELYTWAHPNWNAITEAEAQIRANRVIGTTNSEIPMTEVDWQRLEQLLRSIVTEEISKGVNVNYLLDWTHKKYFSVESFFTGIKDYVTIEKRDPNS